MSGKQMMSCMALIVREPGEVLLLQRKSGRWTLPGGRLKDEESWCHCAIRETAEETGIQLDEAQQLSPLVLHQREAGGVRIYYFARWNNYAGEPHNREPHLHDALAWYALDQLPQDMLPMLRQAIDLVMQGGGVVEQGFVTTGKPKRSSVSANKNMARNKRMLRPKSWRRRLFDYLFPSG